MIGWQEEIEAAAAILSEASRAVALCGAGVSAESGISTFRDPGGLWDRVDPMEMGTVSGLIRSLETRGDQLIPILLELLDSFEKAEVNAGHRALADMEKLGIVRAIITQNADGLQREAGSRDLIEIHGSLFRMRCVFCGTIKTLDRRSFLQSVRERIDGMSRLTAADLVTLAPVCDHCGSMMRPDVVMFGEPVKELPRAFEAARSCDAMLVLGTSGMVYPAAFFPREAREAGARIIVINPTENAFTRITSVYIPAKTGDALPAVLKRVQHLQRLQISG